METSTIKTRGKLSKSLIDQWSIGLLLNLKFSLTPTWISSKRYHHLAPLKLVASLAIRWRPLPYAIRTFCHYQLAPLALVPNLATRWHHLHSFQSWPLGCVTCIVTLPWIAPLALSVSIELVSSSARVTSVKSQQGIVS